MADLSNKTFIVEVDELQSLGVGRIGIYEDDVLKASAIQLRLEASSRSEAADWVFKICSDTSKQQFGDDDACFWMAESAITKREYLRSVESFESNSYLKHFEGALHNDMIRSAFREHLRDMQSEELLSFWEHVEDFRRACANTEDEEAFPFVGLQGEIDSATRREWAQSIFMKYISADAPLQIPGCTEEARDAIKSSLFEDEAIPSSDTFSAFGASVYQRLKTENQFYPSFASLPGHLELLQRALVADRRRNAGFKPLSTFISKDDKITDSDYGILDSKERANSENGIASSFFSLLVGSKSMKQAPKERVPDVDGDADDKQTIVRDTWWRGKEARMELGDIAPLPDWWWRFSTLQMSDTNVTEASIMSAQQASIAPIREQWMRELEVLYGPSNLRDLLAGRHVGPIVLSSLVQSPNYSHSPLDIHGVVKFVGAVLVSSPHSKDPPVLFSCSVVDFLGHGYLMLYQPDGKLAGRILLELISCIQASPTKVNTFTLFEGEEAAYEFACGRASESAGFFVAQAFFRAISLFVPRDAVSIVHAGYVEKRQEGATAALFRRRWCVLLSTGLLVYYKPADKRSVTSFRGEIKLETAHVRVYAASGPLSFSVEIPAKSFQFRTSKKDEREDWARILGSIVAALKPQQQQ